MKLTIPLLCNSLVVKWCCLLVLCSLVVLSPLIPYCVILQCLVIYSLVYLVSCVSKKNQTFMYFVCKFKLSYSISHFLHRVECTRLTYQFFPFEVSVDEQTSVSSMRYIDLG